MSTKEKILRILELALEINPPEIDKIGTVKTAIFVNWSPHCNYLTVRIYEMGWYRGADSVEREVWTDSEDADKKLDSIITELEEILRELTEAQK